MPDAWRCPTCASGAVESQVDARLHLPGIRRDMAGLGVRLATPVQVRIVPVAELNPDGGETPAGFSFGMTYQRWTDIRATVDVVDIRVVAGLPPTMFGRVVTHEFGHAWLAQFGAAAVDPRTEEGVGELFASAWLKRRRTPLADALRQELQENPDPTYGGGYRAVRASVVSHGVVAVLDQIRRTGRLPR
jgi:hypothetical protein